MSAVTEAAVVDVLRTVRDPELALSIVDLGLVYAIRVDDTTVHITMTLTARGCPLHEVMTDWVRAAVGQLPGVERVDVAVTFDPPWTPARMTQAGT